MNDKPVIVVGLVIALVVLTVPFWHALAAGRPGTPPQLELPAGQKKCVEDKQYMRAHHMDLLEQWREAVVRHGQKTYVSVAFGDSHEMSLTKTCLGCHANRQTFCDRCHNYADVRPSCWDCHVGPKEK